MQVDKNEYEHYCPTLKLPDLRRSKTHRAGLVFLVCVLIAGGITLCFTSTPKADSGTVDTDEITFWDTTGMATVDLSKSQVWLPSPSRLQQVVNSVLTEAHKPLIKVDGILGPEFRTGYEAAYCYQQGIYHCEEAGMGEPNL